MSTSSSQPTPASSNQISQLHTTRHPASTGDSLPGDEIALEDFVDVGGSVNLGETAAGALTVAGSVFRLDRSVLSKPLFSEEARARLSDGGPGNTESFDSHALAFDGKKTLRALGLRYHLGWARLGVEAGEPEQRLAAAAQLRFETESRAAFSTLGEVVHFLNAQGDTNTSRTYVTGSLLYEYRGMNGAIAFTNREISGGDAENSTFEFQPCCWFDRDSSFRQNRSKRYGKSHSSRSCDRFAIVNVAARHPP